MKTKKYLIVYHYEDNDGCLSAAMVEYYILHNLAVGQEKIIDRYPANYNKLSEEFEGHPKHFNEYFSQYDVIIMTDISFNNPELMKKLNNIKGTQLVWIDHHKPIIDASYKYRFDDIVGERNTDRSAILNMYNYLYDSFGTKYNEKQIPIILRYLSGWDSWSYEREGLKFDDCRAVNEGVTSYYDLDVDKFLEDMDFFLNSGESSPHLQHLKDKGNEIIKIKDENDKKFCEKCCEFGWHVGDFRTAVACVTSGGTNSIIFKSLRGKADNAIVFKREANGNWIISLYNINDDHIFHCGEYLKEVYCGGGHEGAAGCTIKDIDTIYKMFKDKRI